MRGFWEKGERGRRGKGEGGDVALARVAFSGGSWLLDREFEVKYIK